MRRKYSLEMLKDFIWKFLQMFPRAKYHFWDACCVTQKQLYSDSLNQIRTCARVSRSNEQQINLALHLESRRAEKESARDDFPTCNYVESNKICIYTCWCERCAMWWTDLTKLILLNLTFWTRSPRVTCSIFFLIFICAHRCTITLRAEASHTADGNIR